MRRILLVLTVVAMMVFQAPAWAQVPIPGGQQQPNPPQQESPEELIRNIFVARAELAEQQLRNHLEQLKQADTEVRQQQAELAQRVK